MIVRPNTGSQFNARRSQSTPPRRRSNSASATTASEAASALPPATHLLVQALHSSSKHVPDTLLRASSGKRKLFRLKRPSSSHSEKRPLLDGHAALSPTFPSPPPRPPRNPARVNSRPSTSSGPTEKAHGLGASLPAQSITSVGAHAAARESADWEFPLPVSALCVMHVSLEAH